MGKFLNLAINKKSLNEILISIFVFITIIFPADIFNLKKIILFIIFLINYKVILFSIVQSRNYVVTFFGLLFPTLLILYSTLLTQNLFLSISRSYSSYIFLLVFVVIVYKIDFERIMLGPIKIIMLLTIFLAFLDIIGVYSINDSIFRNNVMYGLELGYMGKSADYPLYYKIFFKTSPLIVFYLFKNFYQSNYFLSIIAIISLLLSGTRANFLFPLLMLLFYFLFSKRKSNLNKILLVTIIVVALLFVASPFLDFMYNILVTKSTVSNTIRQGHIEGLVELVKNNPWYIFSGTGMGSEFFSFAYNSYVSSIEWTFLDLWRQMGLILFLMFITFIIIPLFYRNNTDNYQKYAYLSFLLIASTNPLLFNSTSYVVYIYMYTNTLKKINI